MWNAVEMPGCMPKVVGGMDVAPQVGWYTGWVDNGHGKITAFVLNLEMNAAANPAERKQLTLDVLDKLGLFFYL